MKRAKKPLTFAAIAAGIGALSLAVEACVYGPPSPPETNVYGPPPPELTSYETEETSKETDETVPFSKRDGDNNNEVGVYGPPPDETLDMIAKVWEIAGILVDEKR